MSPPSSSSPTAAERAIVEGVAMQLLPDEELTRQLGEAVGTLNQLVTVLGERGIYVSLFLNELRTIHRGGGVDRWPQLTYAGTYRHQDAEIVYTFSGTL